jgi:hypothetical protein
MSTVPTTEPRALRAGDSAAWRRALAAYPPADGWALAYRIVYASGTAVDIATTPDAGEYAVSLAPATTAAYVAGAATLVGRVTRAGEAVTVYAAPLTILPDLATVANLDPRSSAAKALADAEAALAAYLGSGAHVQSWTIGGKQMTFRSSAELIALVEFYRREVAREQVAARLAAGGAPGRVLVRNR